MPRQFGDYRSDERADGRHDRNDSCVAFAVGFPFGLNRCGLNDHSIDLHIEARHRCAHGGHFPFETTDRAMNFFAHKLIAHTGQLKVRV